MTQDPLNKKKFYLSVVLLILISIFRFLLPERSLEYTGFRAVADNFFSISLLLIVLLVCGGIGLKIIRWLPVKPLTYLETIVFVIPIGLGIFAYGILALGLLGFLEGWILILWFMFAFLWSYQEMWELLITGVNKLKVAIHKFKPLDLGKKLLLVGGVLIFGMTFSQALTPPWDYDGLMYHLQGPRIFLDIGKILLLPDTWGANGPFTIEMLFMFGLRFGSDNFAKLVHLSYAVLLVLATFAFGRRFLRREGGWIAATILVAMPIFPIWASWAYIDIGWALYEFLGIYSFILWVKTLRREYLALSGLMMGFALGSKYVALASAFALGLLLIWHSRKQGLKLLIQNSATFGAIALAIGSPWYLKNWLWTGNPVYPLYFGGLEWPPERVQLLMSYLNSFGTGHQFLDYALLPWNIYAHHEQFATLSGKIEFPSFLYPLLIFYPLVRHKRMINYLAIIVLMKLSVWAVGSQQIRFMLPVFPGLSLLLASTFLGVNKLPALKRIGRIFLAISIESVVIVTLFFSALFLNSVRPSGVVFGSESKMSFLIRKISDMRAIDYIRNQFTTEDRVLFLWDGQGYYCDERCIPDVERGQWTHLVLAADYDISAISTRLRNAGVTHLLLTIEDPGYFSQHDPDRKNYQAAQFFLDQFRERCTKLLFSDQGNYLYEITCN